MKRRATIKRKIMGLSTGIPHLSPAGLSRPYAWVEKALGLLLHGPSLLPV